MRTDINMDKLWETHAKEIMERLQRVIPAPAPPVAKPTKSFRGLKPGDLVGKDGKEYKVMGVDSLHAKVGRWNPEPDQTVIEELDLGVDWTKEFARIPKRRKKKDE